MSKKGKYTEDELIAGCCKGDRVCQHLLFEAYSKRMMAVCLRYSKSTQEAEDILQEGFIKVFQHISGFKKESQLETWMTRIMVNTALNTHRKKIYLFPMVDVEDTPLLDPEDSLSALAVSEIIKSIQSLPHGCQIIFNMYAMEGYSHKEIAGMLDISESTSKSQYARAKELLRKQLQQEMKRLNYGDR